MLHRGPRQKQRGARGLVCASEVKKSGKVEIGMSNDESEWDAIGRRMGELREELQQLEATGCDAHHSRGIETAAQ